MKAATDFFKLMAGGSCCSMKMRRFGVVTRTSRTVVDKKHIENIGLIKQTKSLR
jgi:hypothetical protein